MVIAHKCREQVPDHLRQRIADALGTTCDAGYVLTNVVGIHDRSGRVGQSMSERAVSRHARSRATIARPRGVQGRAGVSRDRMRDRPVDLQQGHVLLPARANASTNPHARSGRSRGSATGTIGRHGICWPPRSRGRTGSLVLSGARSSSLVAAVRRLPREGRPPVPEAVRSRLDDRPGRLGPRRARRRPGRRPRAVRRVVPLRLAPARLRRAHRRGRGAGGRGDRVCARSPGPARARVTDRAGWVRANIASFHRLLRPLTDKLGERMGDGPARRRSVARVAGRRGRARCSAGCRTRVLGQYDLLIVEDEEPDEQDIVYYVGPNVLALEKRFAFPPREFRLWLALHEVTHRAQFTGVPVAATRTSCRSSRRAWRRRPRSQALPRRAATGRRGSCEPAATRSTTAASSPCSRRPSSTRVLEQIAGTDEPARGPRRRHHGPGRRRPHPQRRPLRSVCCGSGAQASGPTPGSSRSCSASRPSSTSTSRASGSSTRSSAEGGTDAARDGVARPASGCRRFAEIRDPSCGSSGVRAPEAAHD